MQEICSTWNIFSLPSVLAWTVNTFLWFSDKLTMELLNLPGKIALITLATLLSTLGCHKPLPNPELEDLIYLDLKHQQESLLKSIKDLDSQAAKAKEVFRHAPIRTGQRQDLEEDYFELVHRLQKMREEYRYVSVKAQHRASQARKEYQTVFKEKKPWPNAEEYRDYKLDEQLAHASREWSPEKRIQSRKTASVTSQNNHEE